MKSGKKRYRDIRSAFFREEGNSVIHEVRRRPSDTQRLDAPTVDVDRVLEPDAAGIQLN